MLRAATLLVALVHANSISEGTSFWKAHGLPALLERHGQQVQILGTSPRPKPTRWVQPRYSTQCVLDGVLAIMEKRFDPGQPLPRVYFEENTPLAQFQDAVQPQWGVRPDVFLNAYAAARNEIYLINDAEYYERTKRWVDDSLAHELAHYVQVRYKNIPIEQFDDSMEHEAVSVQTEFREKFLKPGVSPCGR
ncbi:MAG: hypothetical protein HY925_11360 [Elusimicrobia bacterium]|nr:hypothetical protein [Elusimicrobiota bacterium]